MNNRLRIRLGRRGASLLLMAGIWIAVGVSILLGITDDGSVANQRMIHELVPHQVRGLLWVGAGVIAVFSSLNRGSDWVGFTALLIPPLFRMVSYCWAMFSYWVSGGEAGYEHAWLYAIFYALFVGLVYLTGGWPEPIRIPEPGGDEAEERGESP